jgi:peptide/nickel transport system ATP-binding protein
MALLSVRDLVVRFRTQEATIHAVNGISFDIDRGETLGIVGESGCGKSVTSLALMRLLPKPTGHIEGGAVHFDGRDLLKCSESEMREMRGRDLAMIFQDPMTSLNPVLTVEEQLTETVRAHFELSKRKKKVRARASDLLRTVGIADPENRIREFPHQFSGGMRQRVMIAMALALEPKLLIADEPTTALDVTIQAQVLELLQRLTSERRTATLLITHDLGVVARMAQRVAVMYAGYIVETGSASDLFETPSHPYTIGLLHSIPRGDNKASALVPIEGMPPDQRTTPVGCPFASRCAWRLPVCWRTNPSLRPVQSKSLSMTRFPAENHSFACHNPPTPSEAAAGRPLQERFAAAAPPSVSRGLDGTAVPAPISRAAPKVTPAAKLTGASLLEVRSLKVYFPFRHGFLFGRRAGNVHAVDDVSFTLHRSETLGLVGESGCGKSTTGRAILRLQEPTSGAVCLDGVDITALDKERLRSTRRRMQMIFQDPFASLNPRMTVDNIVAEPLEAHATVAPGERRDKVNDLLAMVGLAQEFGRRYPFEFSGGQRQRIGIARALALNPDLVVADEPVSALDVSIQAQIINLLHRLQDKLGLSYLFIAHDLTIISHISHRIAVMYLGRIVEIADAPGLIKRPLHPYTIALLSAVPIPDPQIERQRRRIVLRGDLPSPANPPAGCRFHTRCWLRQRLGNPERCIAEDPDLLSVSAGHDVACHFAESVDTSPEQAQAAGLS